MIKTDTERAWSMEFKEKFSIKRYLLSIAVVALLILLIELICYPINSAKLTEDAGVKTRASIMLLTDETPPELQIYHRALLLLRYQLDRAMEVKPGAFKTANVDWYQICVVSVENNQIVLSAQKDRATYVMLIVLFAFTNVVYLTENLIHLEAKIRKKGA